MGLDAQDFAHPKNYFFLVPHARYFCCERQAPSRPSLSGRYASLDAPVPLPAIIYCERGTGMPPAGASDHGYYQAESQKAKSTGDLVLENVIFPVLCWEVLGRQFTILQKVFLSANDFFRCGGREKGLRLYVSQPHEITGGNTGIQRHATQPDNIPKSQG